MPLYLLLNIGSIFFPFVLSFDKKVAFFKQWYALFPAILCSATVFIVWDIWFTDMGVWHFNDAYLVGIYLAGLPLEEWLFFFTIPYACVFIYACIRAYFPKASIGIPAHHISLVIAILLLVGGIWAIDRWYPAVTFLATSALLFYHVRQRSAYMQHFYWTYLIHLIPLFIVNGVLTATPIVIYNNLENLGIRLGTVPMEDPFYSMLLLLLTIQVFEWRRSKAKTPNAQVQMATSAPQTV